MIEFFIPGKLVGKERARPGKNKRHYTPEKTRAFEKKVGLYALQARQKAGITKPTHEEVSLTVLFCYPEKGRIPDNSNVLKAIEDGMNKIIYDDDRQIARNIVDRIRDDSRAHGVWVWVTNYWDVK